MCVCACSHMEERNASGVKNENEKDFWSEYVPPFYQLGRPSPGKCALTDMGSHLD